MITIEMKTQQFQRMVDQMKRDTALKFKAVLLPLGIICVDMPQFAQLEHNSTTNETIIRAAGETFITTADVIIRADN